MTPCERNQISYARARLSLPGHTVFERPFALWGMSSHPCGECLVTACHFDDPHAQIDEILRTYQSARQIANWVVGPSAQPTDLGKILHSERRLMGPMHLPSMELDLRSCVRRVPTDSTFQIEDWEFVTEHGHPKQEWMPKAARSCVIPTMRALSALGNTYYFVATVDEQIASCVTVHVADETAGIYDVITRPDFRGRGGATAVLHHALNFARDLGCEVAVLQSHKKATGLYTRLGFEEVGLFMVYYYSRPRMLQDAKLSQS